MEILEGFIEGHSYLKMQGIVSFKDFNLMRFKLIILNGNWVLARNLSTTDFTLIVFPIPGIPEITKL